MFKKCTALLLALVLAVSLFPAVGVQAASDSTVPYTEYFSAEEWEVLKLVNKERNTAGLDPLTGFALLQEVAHIRAEELVEKFSHTRPNGSSCFSTYNEVGVDYHAAGENIAAGYYSAESVMVGWMNSDGHRDNILNGGFTSVGLGYWFEDDGGYRHHWTQNFLGFPYEFTNYHLVMPKGHIIPQGMSLDELDIYLVLENAADGYDHYLPLTEELVSGFTGELGRTSVSFDLLGVSGSFEISVVTAFDDVKASDYYYDPVLWALDKGVTSGTSSTKFSPYDACLRSQVVTFLWRAAGKPTATSKDNPFVDVKPGDYYYDAVLWAVEKGITYGADSTHFEPNGVCNRSQVVTFLYRAFVNAPVDSTANPFTDVPAGEWYAAPVLWAVKEGIAYGLSATKFGPNDVCNRSQVVTFLYRAYN